MDKLTAIQTIYDRNGISYRFVRKIAEDKDNAGLHRAKMFWYDDMTISSKHRIDKIICGHLTQRTYEHITDNNQVTVTYTIVDRPETYHKGGIEVYQNLLGNLVLKADEATREQIRTDLGQNDYEYPQTDEYLWSLFENTDLEYIPDTGEAGFGLTSAPGILKRVYYPEDHPKYNGDDDDLGTDYKRSKLWVYSAYALFNMVEHLAGRGEIELHFVPNLED